MEMCRFPRPHSCRGQHLCEQESCQNPWKHGSGLWHISSSACVSRTTSSWPGAPVNLKVHQFSVNMGCTIHRQALMYHAHTLQAKSELLVTFPYVGLQSQKINQFARHLCGMTTSSTHSIV